MNGNSRFLPRLNLCYLQKKAYEVHLRKMNKIMNPSKCGSLCDTKGATIEKYKITTIKERTERPESKLSPYRKKVRQQTERQNIRLFQAIEKCPSTINRKNLSMHSLQNEQVRERLAKFKVLPGSRKTLLKCEISLERISRKEGRSIYSSMSQPSHSGSRMKEEAQQARKEEGPRTSSLFKKERQDYTESLLVRRNQGKMKSHFQRSEIALRTKEKLMGFRENVQSKGMHPHPIHKWKTRCFTTQAESHLQDSL